jgi:hypothetical protein
MNDRYAEKGSVEVGTGSGPDNTVQLATGVVVAWEGYVLRRSLVLSVRAVLSSLLLAVASALLST